jgi:CBS domain-containing protein
VTTRQQDGSAAPAGATLDDDPGLTALMTGRVVAITPDAPLRTALALMAAERVRHLPVLHGTRCLGVVGETDLVHAVAVGGPPVVGPLARRTPALAPADRRSAAARAMVDSGGDVVLVGERGRLVGIVTATDLLVSLAAGGPAGDAAAER